LVLAKDKVTQWLEKANVGPSRFSARDNKSRTNNAVESFTQLCDGVLSSVLTDPVYRGRPPSTASVRTPH